MVFIVKLENFNNKKYELKVGRLGFYIGFKKKQFKRIKLLEEMVGNVVKC